MQTFQPLRSTVLAAFGLVLAASPAFPQAGQNTDQDRAFQAATEAQDSRAAIIQNGIPTVIEGPDNSATVVYQGEARGNLSAGVPVASNKAGGGYDVTHVPPAPPPAAPAAAARPAPAHAAAPPGAVALLDQAARALQAREFSTARDRLERAETLLLNARRDGESGFAAPVGDIASARAAVARRDASAAQTSVAAAKGGLARGS
jgi:hypothetical protein